MKSKEIKVGTILSDRPSGFTIKVIGYHYGSSFNGARDYVKIYDLITLNEGAAEFSNSKYFDVGREFTITEKLLNRIIKSGAMVEIPKYISNWDNKLNG